MRARKSVADVNSVSRYLDLLFIFSDHDIAKGLFKSGPRKSPLRRARKIPAVIKIPVLLHVSPTMSSQEIQSLLAPADTQQAYSKASIYLNSKFSSLEDLGCLENDVTQAQQRRDELETRVRRVDTGSRLLAHRLHTSSASSFQVKNQHSHSRNASGRRVASSLCTRTVSRETLASR